MIELARGENRPLPSSVVALTVTCASRVDVSAVLLGPDGRVRSDADLVFYNNSASPGVQYSPTPSGDVVRVDTAAVDRGVETIAITASLDGSGPATFASAGFLHLGVADHTGVDVMRFAMSGLSTESAVVCAEIYRRGDTWKVRAVGQGYDTGLAGIATAFGIQIDAEPEPVAAPTPTHSQGVTPMRSELFDPVHAEVGGVGIQKQGSKMAKVSLNGEVMARSGSMVAYQGNLRFEALGAGGIGNAIRQRLSGEGVPLMKVVGQGDLFLANVAQDVHLIDLDGSDGLTINGANVLAFESTLSYQIARVQGAAAMSNAGLFNCVFTGRGRIAITTDGAPVVLNVDQPTFADPQAAVAWSSSLQTGVQRNDQFNLGTLIGRSTGERFTLSFSGQGFVIVQPSEQPRNGFVGGTGGGQQAGVGGALGGLLGR